MVFGLSGRQANPIPTQWDRVEGADTCKGVHWDLVPAVPQMTLGMGYLVAIVGSCRFLFQLFNYYFNFKPFIKCCWFPLNSFTLSVYLLKDFVYPQNELFDLLSYSANSKVLWRKQVYFFTKHSDLCICNWKKDKMVFCLSKAWRIAVNHGEKNDIHKANRYWINLFSLIMAWVWVKSLQTGKHQGKKQGSQKL